MRFYFVGGYIAVPIADALVLLADVGFDVLQLFVDALSFDAFSRRLVCFGVPKGRGVWFSLQLNCAMVPLTVIRPITGTLPFFSFCLFR